MIAHMLLIFIVLMQLNFSNHASFDHAEILRLNDNIISGEIPASLSKLVGLKELRLDDNLLVGEIPVEFSALTNLGE